MFEIIYRYDPAHPVPPDAGGRGGGPATAGGGEQVSPRCWGRTRRRSRPGRASSTSTRRASASAPRAGRPGSSRSPSCWAVPTPAVCPRNWCSTGPATSCSSSVAGNLLGQEVLGGIDYAVPVRRLPETGGRGARPQPVQGGDRGGRRLPAASQLPRGRLSLPLRGHQRPVPGGARGGGRPRRSGGRTSCARDGFGWRLIEAARRGQRRPGGRGVAARPGQRPAPRGPGRLRRLRPGDPPGRCPPGRSGAGGPGTRPPRGADRPRGVHPPWLRDRPQCGLALAARRRRGPLDCRPGAPTPRQEFPVISRDAVPPPVGLREPALGVRRTRRLRAPGGLGTRLVPPAHPVLGDGGRPGERAHHGPVAVLPQPGRLRPLVGGAGAVGPADQRDAQRLAWKLRGACLPAEGSSGIPPPRPLWLGSPTPSKATCAVASVCNESRGSRMIPRRPGTSLCTWLAAC